MDSAVFGCGVVGAVLAAAGGFVFLGQQTRLAELALIPTSVALTLQAINFKRTKNMVLASSSVTAALLDDGVEALITGTVQPHDEQSVNVETSAQQRKTGGRVAAVLSTVSQHGAAADAKPRPHRDEWVTFELHDGTGSVVCPKHIFLATAQIPKTVAVRELWDTEDRWFGGKEVKQIASLKESLERGVSDGGVDFHESTLPFGATLTLHGKVRLSDDEQTLVVEQPVTITQNSRASILSEMLVRCQRTKLLSLGLIAGGVASVGYAVYRYRVNASRARKRRERADRVNAATAAAVAAAAAAAAASSTNTTTVSCPTPGGGGGGGEISTAGGSGGGGAVAGSSDLCMCCVAQPKNAVLVPCGHQSMCHDCAMQWLLSTPQCPICRTRVKRVQKIFRA